MWFKNKEFHSESWKVILKNPGMDTSVFKKGIPNSALKNKWRNMLLILQKFIICEGRFGCKYVYHIRLLMNFLEDGEINLPFFLLNSLKIMSTNVQKRIQFIDNTTHHHGLIKILLEFHLKSIGDSWENFLIRNHFQEVHEQPKEENIRKSRRKKIDTNIEDRLASPLQKNDENLISAELTKNKKQGKVKAGGKIEKRSKVTIRENLNSPQLRRSSRLRGSMKKTLPKETEFISLDEETPIPSPINILPPHSLQNSPIHNFEGSSSRKSLGIDPTQQEIYDYIETLEKRNEIVNPEHPINLQEPLVDTLK